MDWIQRATRQAAGRLTLPNIDRARDVIARLAPADWRLDRLIQKRLTPGELVTGVLAVAIGGLILAQQMSGQSLLGAPRLVDKIGQGDISIELEPVADGLTAPNWAAAAPGLADHLFVVDQIGLVWAVNLTDNSKQVFLDVTNALVPLGFAGEGTFDERGLLGLAFHPDFAANGLFYTHTSEPATEGTATFPVPGDGAANHHSVIAEWLANAPEDPSRGVNLLSRRELMRIGQPQFNHNGGALNFGPDRHLYIALGDGGGGNDMGQGHTDFVGNAQDTSNVLGTILRIDPDRFDAENGQYGIPPDNPFVGEDGVPDEIYAYGFHNPVRFSIDANGDLYVGDVGESGIEEIDLIARDDAGGNYGWNTKEGSACFEVDDFGASFAYAADGESGLCPDLLDDGALIDPIAEYDSQIEGHSIVGGFVYRGDAIDGLEGRYVFADASSAYAFAFNDPAHSAFNRPVVKVDAAPGRLFYLSDANTILEFQGDGLTATVLGLGQDAAGALYVLGNTTATPSGGTGIVQRITAGNVTGDGG
jgi:glucose/arabinose dehydrogenase